MRGATAAPGSALAAAAELVLFFFDDDELHPPAIRAGAAPRALAMGGAAQAPRAAEEGGSEAAEPSPPDARDTLPASVTRCLTRPRPAFFTR